jgi:hypothetical protein
MCAMGTCCVGWLSGAAAGLGACNADPVLLLLLLRLCAQAMWC